tara:strand:+ start:102010 stop:102183 length:174 start_codon:yes stop_codon:yes gene_type:complete
MKDKRVVGIVAVVVLAVAGYFFGGDAVDAFRGALGVAPVTSEVAPVTSGVAPTTTAD